MEFGPFHTDWLVDIVNGTQMSHIYSSTQYTTASMLTLKCFFFVMIVLPTSVFFSIFQCTYFDTQIIPLPVPSQENMHSSQSYGNYQLVRMVGNALFVTDDLPKEVALFIYFQGNVSLSFFSLTKPSLDGQSAVTLSLKVNETSTGTLDLFSTGFFLPDLILISLGQKLIIVREG